ncbi:MAG: ROK family protein [Anaerolineae bacterium]
MALYGGIEGGGTKFVCAVGTGPDDIRAEATFPTTTPTETIARAVAFFAGQRCAEPLTAIGIASFGPIDPDPISPTYGYITSTPKPGWAHTDLAGAIHTALDVPVGFDTDVNVAALGEGRWGAAQGLHTFVYLTVGTGIGGGGMVNGKLMHGMMHPEMGHMRIPHDRDTDPFPGWCPYHGDCWEGLAAGPAVAARWGTRGENLPAMHPAWPLEARYLALGLVNIVCTLSPQRIITGGGIMQHPGLIDLVREEVQRLLNGYLQAPGITGDIAHTIVLPGLGSRSGALGAIALAERAALGGLGAAGLS